LERAFSFSKSSERGVMNRHFKLLPGTASSNTEEEPDLRLSIHFSSTEGELYIWTFSKARRKQKLQADEGPHVRTSSIEG
jgi:hypothetical protein